LKRIVGGSYANAKQGVDGATHGRLVRPEILTMEVLILGGLTIAAVSGKT